MEKWIIGHLDTPAGRVPQVNTTLDHSDILGAWKVRWNMGRMNYIVTPGLYAAGRPDETSPVMVSANYKLSFDALRKGLDGLNAWILVVDTKGINVWCAAGKGTFGTEEIANRIRAVSLDKAVSHRRLVVPQLGAPGVSAHRLKDLSGFSVRFGPVRAEDIKAFLNAGMKADKAMRRVRFGLSDRSKLVGIEIMTGLKYFAYTAAGAIILSGLGRHGYSLKAAAAAGTASVILLFAAFLSGAAAGPLLLPWLPGRAFSIKGAFAGLGAALAALHFLSPRLNGLEVAAWFLLIPATASFITMNFTGASTYTSLSGVKKEMRIAVPVQAVLAVSGMALWLAGRFV